MLWPQANVKALTHPSAVAREFPPQRVPKGGAQLTLGAQSDGEGGMAVEAATAPCILPGAEGSQPPGKKLGWWVGSRRRYLPALVPHPASLTLSTGKETWDPMGPYSSQGV